jgi:hypothetical protein
VLGRCNDAVFNILVTLGTNDPRSLWGGAFHVSVLNKNLKKANPFGLRISLGLGATMQAELLLLARSA